MPACCRSGASAPEGEEVAGTTMVGSDSRSGQGAQGARGAVAGAGARIVRVGGGALAGCCAGAAIVGVGGAARAMGVLSARPDRICILSFGIGAPTEALVNDRSANSMSMHVVILLASSM